MVEAVNYSLEQMGEPAQEPAAIKSFIGYPLSQMYPHFTTAPVKELYRYFQIRAAETVVSSTIVLPGVQQTLDTLRQRGYKLAIATTKIRAHVDGILKKFGWRSHFGAYAGGNEVVAVKPDPSILQLVLQRLGASASDSVVVGDTVNDILAARAVPMPVIAVQSPYGGYEKLTAAEPDGLIKSVAELPGLLNDRSGGTVRPT